MNTSDLFEKVGGREQAATVCGVSLWATYKWDEDGIPSKHWRSLADASGLTIDEVSKTAPIKGGPANGAAA